MYECFASTYVLHHMHACMLPTEMSASGHVRGVAGDS